MLHQEKFIPRPKVETPSNNNEISDYKSEDKNLEINSENDDTEKQTKEISKVREEIKQYHSTAKILKVTSTPRAESNKNNETFLEFVFPKLKTFADMTQADRRIAEEEKQKKEEAGIPEDKEDYSFQKLTEEVKSGLKEEASGIKKFFKKIFS